MTNWECQSSVTKHTINQTEVTLSATVHQTSHVAIWNKHLYHTLDTSM